MDCLLAITNDDSNYVALAITGDAYYVDWGDGNGNIPYGSGATAYGPQQNVTFTNGSASIGWPGATELAAGQIVRFLTTGALPTGFAINTNYFVSATGLTATTFQLAATNGGTPIVAGSAGSGTQTALVTYDFATFDPTNATLTTYGYKQAIVKVTPQSGQHITGISFQVKHPILATLNATPQWLDIAINCGNCTSLAVGGATVACSWVQRVNVLSIGSITNFYNMFASCYSLQSVPLFNTAAGTNFSYMFYQCYSLQSVPLFNTAAGTDFYNMFYGCSSLQSVPLFNTAAGTNFSNMFYQCYSLAWGALSGTTYAISYSGCKLSEAALVATFTALGSANGGSQTITVTGTWGDALLTAADKAIATGKGWTVAT
jgi:hypothetical protein